MSDEPEPLPDAPGVAGAGAVALWVAGSCAVGVAGTVVGGRLALALGRMLAGRLGEKLKLRLGARLAITPVLPPHPVTEQAVTRIARERSTP
jgi:hypothetical protein